MKIEGPGPLRPSSNRPSKGSSKSGSSSFADSLGGTGKGAQSVAGGAPITQVDALLSLQEVPDSLERRKRHVKRGFDLLERLEVIRDALLTGQLPLNRLDDLATALRKQREAVDDPRLKEIIEEIELRCAVELAKLGR
ncbi:flagellar assembly protein FliX [Marinibaculum pumilum]|uniref:Flagellar assembly protein FliX n=1 Tax=Marinibaculum pumilum TaxID=1766165 RepID=A0ABV7L4Z5_9PROT